MRHDRHFVDELVNHAATGVGMMIAIGQLEVNPEQPRSDLGELAGLAESIRARGVLEPILVRRLQGQSPRFQIVAGERRFRAALQVGLAELPCVEVVADDQEALELALVENLQRRDLSPFEEAEGFQRLIESHGYTHERIASSVGKSRSTVTETLKLLVIPPAIRDLCRHADITARGMLLLVARANSIDEMEQLVQDIAEGGLDREEAREAARRLRRDPAATAADSRHAEVPSTNAASMAGRFRPLRLYLRREADAPVHLSLSIRRPGITRNEVIAAIEETLDQLRRGELDERLTPRE
jgi:ParB family transcriptional regulator, chromosome partitioning protein